MRTTPPSRADPARIAALLDQLRACGTGDGLGVSRIAFSPEDLAARRFLVEVATEQGLDVAVDSYANLHCRLDGADADLDPYGFGSHLDTVPSGGNLDGAGGVVVGLEVARLLAGAEMRRGVSVVDFTGEEAGPFGVSTIGSRGLAGVLGDWELALRDADGRSLAERIAEACADAGVASLDDPRFAAFIEVHIEQGERLDVAGLPLAVVEGITAIRRTRVRVEGEANHAGTTTRGRRRDALLAVAEMLVAAERAWVTGDPDERVALTVGRLDVTPNAINVIPARVDLVLEVRCPDAGLLEAVDGEAHRRIDAVAASRDVRVMRESLSDQAPRAFDSSLTDDLRAGCAAVGADPPALWSLAGHDAGHVGLLCPAGMVFVRTIGGISHAPGEHADPADLALAADAVALAILGRDGRERS